MSRCGDQIVALFRNTRILTTDETRKKSPVESEVWPSWSRRCARIRQATPPAGLDTFQSLGLSPSLGYLMGVISSCWCAHVLPDSQEARSKRAHAEGCRGVAIVPRTSEEVLAKVEAIRSTTFASKQARSDACSHPM